MRKLMSVAATAVLATTLSVSALPAEAAFVKTGSKKYTIGTCVLQKGKSVERLNPNGCVHRLSSTRAVVYMGNKTGQKLFDYKTIKFNVKNWQKGDKLAMRQQWKVGYWTKVWGTYGKTPVIYTYVRFGV